MAEAAVVLRAESLSTPLHTQKRAGVRCAGLLSELWAGQRCDRCPSRASATQQAGKTKHVAISYCTRNYHMINQL